MSRLCLLVLLLLVMVMLLLSSHHNPRARHVLFLRAHRVKLVSRHAHGIEHCIHVDVHCRVCIRVQVHAGIWMGIGAAGVHIWIVVGIEVTHGIAAVAHVHATGIRRILVHHCTRASISLHHPSAIPLHHCTAPGPLYVSLHHSPCARHHAMSRNTTTLAMALTHHPSRTKRSGVNAHPPSYHSRHSSTPTSTSATTTTTTASHTPHPHAASSHTHWHPRHTTIHQLLLL
jgi:hypothetical protein